MTDTNGQLELPNVMGVIDQLQDIDNDADCLAAATRLIDQVRTDLLPELAAVRRQRAHKARAVLVSQGMSVTEATRVLAGKVGASPQTIMRLITEKGAYGE